jgi:hypothetical protein
MIVYIRLSVIVTARTLDGIGPVVDEPGSENMDI